LRTVDHERRRTSLTELLEQANEAWDGTKLFQPDWSDRSRSLALGGELKAEGQLFHLILNAYWEPLEFELPELENGSPWRRWIDTSLDSPQDIVPWEASPTIPGNIYQVGPRSVAMLIARQEKKS
jgi:glycogen operon protein